MSEKLAIIADDFTGASDSGVHFSRAGRQIDLLTRGLKPEPDHGNDVSLTTESRFMAPDNAAIAVSAVIDKCYAAGFKWIFKKIDSTLRGNPGSEIEASLHATGRTAALICTAMPKTGRTCMNGKIYIDGVPLHKTEIGDDPFNPVSTSSIKRLLGQQTTLSAALLSTEELELGTLALANRIRTLIQSGIRLIIADAVTDDHLLALAKQVTNNDILPVGAGGFARALASIKTSDRITGLKVCKPKGPMLAIIGSLSRASHEQADITCAGEYFSSFNVNPHDKIEDIEMKWFTFREKVDELNFKPNILVRPGTSKNPENISKAEGERVARLLGSVASLICRTYACKTIFATGGSTSMGIAQALKIESISLKDEFVPGVVLGNCKAPHTNIEWFISKAGGFGDGILLNKLAEKIII